MLPAIATQRLANWTRAVCGLLAGPEKRSCLLASVSTLSHGVRANLHCQLDGILDHQGNTELGVCETLP